MRVLYLYAGLLHREGVAHVKTQGPEATNQAE